MNNIKGTIVILRTSSNDLKQKLKVFKLCLCLNISILLPVIRPLRKMVVGMVLAALAFAVAAVIQLQIDVSKKSSKVYQETS